MYPPNPNRSAPSCMSLPAHLSPFSPRSEPRERATSASPTTHAPTLMTPCVDLVENRTHPRRVLLTNPTDYCL